MAASPQGPLRASRAVLCDKIAKRDYLEQESLEHEIHRRLDHHPGAARILDLGCANVRLLQSLSLRPRTRDYVAVAHDAQTLEQVQSQLHGVATRIRFVVAETLDFLWGAAAPFDLIIAGYALNRLSLEEKEAFVHLAKTRLSARGTLLVYDVFRQPNESRQACLRAYSRIIDESWIGLEPRELETLKRRASEYAHPEELDSFRRIAMNAGLDVDGEPAWTGRNPYHTLLSLRHARGAGRQARASIGKPGL